MQFIKLKSIKTTQNKYITEHYVSRSSIPIYSGRKISLKFACGSWKFLKLRIIYEQAEGSGLGTGKRGLFMWN